MRSNRDVCISRRKHQLAQSVPFSRPFSSVTSSILSHASVPHNPSGAERLTEREGGRDGCSFNSRVNPGRRGARFPRGKEDGPVSLRAPSPGIRYRRLAVRIYRALLIYEGNRDAALAFRSMRHDASARVPTPIAEMEKKRNALKVR